MEDDMPKSELKATGKKKLNEISFDELNQIRKEQKLTFKELDNTKEYAETHYYGIKARYLPQLRSNYFWADLAEHIAKMGSLKNFVTSHFITATSSLNEILLTLALLDLPFVEESHGLRSEQGRRVEVKAASNLLLFLKDIQPTNKSFNCNLLVVHRYLEHSNQTEVKEFLVNQPYECQVIFTNISNTPLNFQTLTQVPAGSIPIFKTHTTKSHLMSLSPFTTQTFNLCFIFPRPGLFQHFPTNLSVEGEVVATAQLSLIEVKTEQSHVNEADIDDVIATGSVQEITRFMRTQNILGGAGSVKFSLRMIYWLCKDKDFYQQGLKILKSKNLFDPTFWSYSLHHQDLDTMREYFSSDFLGLRTKVGPNFRSRLLSLNDREESHDLFNFLDYYPIVNARAHRLGGMDQQMNTAQSQTKEWILNKNLRETYERQIKHLMWKARMTASDRLQMVCYLMMQERVREAREQFNKVRFEGGDASIEDGEARLQYDYMEAFFEFQEAGERGDAKFDKARKITQKYKGYPVHHWNVLFKAIEDQINEIDLIRQNRPVEVSEVNLLEDADYKAVKANQVLREPQLDFEVNPHLRSVSIDYVNLEQVKVSYYPVDMEVMFSKSPFFASTSSTDDSAFTFVQPVQTQELLLNSSHTLHDFPLPADLASQNLIIEITAQQQGLKRSHPYFSTSIKVHMIESMGDLKVSVVQEKHKEEVPLPMTYVKVYSKQGSDTTFFKDGYTDLRGRFDYAHLSGASIQGIDKFAIFVSHELHGSTIKEARKPAQ